MKNKSVLRLGSSNRRHAFNAISLAVLAMASAPALAFKVDVGNPDLDVTLDTTVRYNFAERTGKRDPAVIGTNPQVVPAVDEGNYTFDKGDTLLSRLDLFSELDVGYKGKAGLRVSAAAWLDENFPNRTKQAPLQDVAASNYIGGEYSAYVKRFYQGPSGEVLDAFVWGNFDIGSTQLNVKAGRFGLLPGEFLFGNGGSVSFSMAPSDGRKNDLSPGSSAKETVIPIGQVAATWQLNPEWSVMGNVTTEFRSSRISEGGTFWSVADTALEGPQRINQAFRRVDSLEGKSGDVALGVKWSPQALDGDALGLWVRRFDDKNPTWQNQLSPSRFSTGAPGSPPVNTPLGGVGRAVYAQNIDLVGLTYNTVLFGWGSGFEFNVRRNMPLAIRQGVFFGNARSTLQNDPALEGPRGTTLHFLYSGALTLNKNALFDSGSVAVQFDANHIQKVTRNANRFNGNFDGGPVAACGSQAVLRNCATRSAASVGVSFIPTWQQALPSTDISLPLLLLYGLTGNSGIVGAGTLPEGSFLFRPTLRVEYSSGTFRHLFDLSLTKRGGRTGVLPGATAKTYSGLANFSDRDFVSFTYSTGF